MTLKILSDYQSQKVNVTILDNNIDNVDYIF